MIRSGKLFFHLLTAMFALLMLVQITSCGRRNENDTEEVRPNIYTSVITPATPGIGLGRATHKTPAKPNGIIICIDPGHGFMDGGCGENYLPNGILEKDVTLAIANKLSEDLQTLGFTTIMTHDGENLPQSAVADHIYNPNERIAYANTITFDYFISIHVNSYEQDPDVSGTRIYYMNNAIKINKQGGVIAEIIGKNLEINMPDEPLPVIIDQAVGGFSYALVRDIKTPSSLIEVGFCTNESDAANMVKDEWQENYAQALANGISEYYTEYLE